MCLICNWGCRDAIAVHVYCSRCGTIVKDKETLFRTEDAQHTWCTKCYKSMNVEAAGAVGKRVLSLKRDTSRRVGTVFCSGMKAFLHD
ncbi:unnamed protein product, partial [Pylaiella littoralis]